jgi:hypothetical protein
MWILISLFRARDCFLTAISENVETVGNPDVSVAQTLVLALADVQKVVDQIWNLHVLIGIIHYRYDISVGSEYYENRQSALLLLIAIFTFGIFPRIPLSVVSFRLILGNNLLFTMKAYCSLSDTVPSNDGSTYPKLVRT